MNESKDDHVHGDENQKFILGHDDLETFELLRSEIGMMSRIRT